MGQQVHMDDTEAVPDGLDDYVELFGDLCAEAQAVEAPLEDVLAVVVRARIGHAPILELV